MAMTLALAWCGGAVRGFTMPAADMLPRKARAPSRVTMYDPAEPTTATASAQLAEANPDAWLNLWFPVMFASGVPGDGLVAATVFERPLVLFRDRNTSAVQCLADQCPHRLAPLSDGRLVVDDDTGTTRVECSYHGWQFSGCGRCTKLPQLESTKPILPLYDALAYPVAESQGIVYVFIGEAGRAQSVEVPRVPELDREGWIYEQDYMRDLPYDYTTLVENIIDPSHVPVSHHGTVQGDRSLAQPLTTKVRISAEAADGALPLGFVGTTEVPLHASSRLSFAQQKAEQKVEFTAPSLLSYKFSVGAGDALALFYPIPISRGRSRVLVRRGRNFATERKMSTTALVAKHLENNIVFDQDMAFLRGQEARLQAISPDGWGGAWRAAAISGTTGYVMPADADKFVISFRKQLDRVASALPWLSPPPSPQSAHEPPLPRRALLDRLEQHTKHCAVCMAALHLTERCLRLSRVAAQAALMAALAALASRAPPSPLFLLSCALGATAYSSFLLRAYVVGPVVGALSNRVAAVPLAAAAVLLAACATRPASAAAHVCAVTMPLTIAGAAIWATQALEMLRARFIYTEEAKVLQIS
jgi:phenylpropionate dioxygenase-like ring-hydroxylating dioxygenase large terminal subunit